MVSKEDVDWRGERDAALVERDTRYTLHRVTNLILVVCQFAAVICHIVCFGVLLTKINQLDDVNIPGDDVCVLYMSVNDSNAVKYSGGSTCNFVIFTSVILTILAATMLIFLIVRLFLVSKMNFFGLFDVVEIIIAVLLTFTVSVTISIGRSVTCSNLTKSLYKTCSDISLPDPENQQVPIYSAMKSSETSSWVAFLFLFVVAVVTISRTVVWFRKLRRERSWNVSTGLVSSEVPSSTYEEVDKNP